MAIVNKPYEFTDNTAAEASEVNANFDTLYNDYNGGITAANLATDAVTTAKIANSNVTTAKIADNAVTVPKLDSELQNGWQAVSDSWTYASATTITVPSDATTKYSVGDKIKLVQSATTKYFYVTAVSSTVLTVTGGSDYTVANSAISGIYYSKAATPLGFPQFFNYTATWTNLTVGNGTGVYRFAMYGKTVFVRLEFVLGSSSSVSTAPNFTLPTTSSTTGYTGAAAPQLGVGTVYDSGTAFYPAVVHWNSSTTAKFRVQNAGATYLTQADITSSVPMASWATGDTLSCEIIYETA